MQQNSFCVNDCTGYWNFWSVKNLDAWMKWPLDTGMLSLLVVDLSTEMPSTQHCSQSWIISFRNGHSIPSCNVIKNWLPASWLNASVVCTCVDVTVDMVRRDYLHARHSKRLDDGQMRPMNFSRKRATVRPPFSIVFRQPILVIYLHSFQVLFFAYNPVDMAKRSKSGMKNGGRRERRRWNGKKKIMHTYMQFIVITISLPFVFWMEIHE